MKRRTFISGCLSAFLLSNRSLLFANNDSAEILVKNNTGYISAPVFMDYHIDPRHPESPDRIQHINSAMRNSGLIDKVIKIHPETDISDWIETIHSPEHILSVETYFPDADRVAKAGVSAAITAIDKIMDNTVDNAFCASRPPGHHALNTGREEGFCYYNNVAIAARYAQRHYGLEKILIIDWDYHHGNGTEAAFYDDPSVLFFSTHDNMAYPGTGDPAKKGSGKGRGYNINVHLPCGTNDEEIIEAFNTELLPVVKTFKPNLILVSAGFDSRKNDLLGCFDVSDDGFIKLTKIVMELANQYCDGRLVSILEGGYNLNGNAKAVVAHISTLLTHK